MRATTAPSAGRWGTPEEYHKTDYHTADDKVTQELGMAEMPDLRWLFECFYPATLLLGGTHPSGRLAFWLRTRKSSARLRARPDARTPTHTHCIRSNPTSHTRRTTRPRCRRPSRASSTRQRRSSSKVRARCCARTRACVRTRMRVTVEAVRLCSARSEVTCAVNAQATMRTMQIVSPTS